MSRPATVPGFAVPRAKTRGSRWVFVSLTLHLLAVALIVGVESGFLPDLFGTGGGIGPAGGGGGGGVRYVTIPAYVPTATSTPRFAQSDIRFVASQPSMRTIAPVSRVEATDWPTELLDVVPRPGANRGVGGGVGSGPGAGGGQGSGLGTGRGSDVGPGTGGNRGYTYAPEPRALHYPVDEVPDELRGVELSIHFWVDATGRVTRIEIDPPIEDRDYLEALRETLMGWVFYPARTASGARVPGEMVVKHRP